MSTKQVKLYAKLIFHELQLKVMKFTLFAWTGCWILPYKSQMIKLLQTTKYKVDFAEFTVAWVISNRANCVNFVEN